MKINRFPSSLAILSYTFATTLLPVSASDFYSGVSTDVVQGSEFFAGSNLTQGSGSGFDAAEPHNQLGGGGGAFTWVTDGSGADYYGAGGGIGPTPIIVFDLGSDVLLSEISTWGYADTNSNGARDFSLRFATSAEGAAGFGTTIADQTGFIAGFDYGQRTSNPLTIFVTARYVEMTITDNWRGLDPGGSPGGDRVGLGEVAFELLAVVREPNIAAPTESMPLLDFDSPTSIEIPVTNTGDQDLIITGTNFIGANAAAFTVTAVTSPIAPLAIENVTLEFNPAGLGGPISATLQITSNDPDTPTSEVLINSSLPALGPDISVPAGFALTAGGLAETLVIPVENLGRAQLDIASTNIIGPNNANFVVTILPANIAALASDNIEIAFDPAGLSTGAISATFQILSNDPDTPTAEILLSGGIAESFYPISSVTSATEPAGSDFYLATNLIQGPGTGFDALWPHDALGFAQPFAWVTDAPNGGAGDYFDPVPAVRPNMVFDLGSDVGLGEISFWGYSDDNANGANLFSLRFATSADGPNGFGTSISYKPEFAPIQDQTERQSFEFDQGVFARYVEWMPLDNFFGINPPGGDRVGAGEIAFAVRAVDNEITILSIARGADDVTLTFKSRDGLSYAIFRSPDLGETGWQELDDSFASQGDETTFVDFNVPEGIQRMFYQVRNAGE